LHERGRTHGCILTDWRTGDVTVCHSFTLSYPGTLRQKTTLEWRAAIKDRSMSIYVATWSNTRSASSYANVYTHTGRQLGTETGMYYFRARFFSAQLGRFLKRDPIGVGDGSNLCQYAADAPSSSSDPIGLFPLRTAESTDDAKELPPVNGATVCQEESDFIKKYCSCSTSIVSTDDLRRSKDTLAFLECVDGKMTVGWNNYNDTVKDLLASYAACGFKKCIEKHEQHHVAQCEVKNPDVCKDKTRPSGAIYMVSNNSACIPKLECWSSKVELECFLAQFAENEKDGAMKCRPVAKKYIEGFEKYTGQYECDFGDLQARLDEVKRLLNVR
jgi:RHS repeat-associated protein